MGSSNLLPFLMCMKFQIIAKNCKWVTIKQVLVDCVLKSSKYNLQ